MNSSELYALAEARANSPENVRDVLQQAMEGSCCRLGVHELTSVGTFKRKQGQMIFGTRQECSLCGFRTESVWEN